MLAACSTARPEGIAVAACLFDLPAKEAGHETQLIQILPAGEFAARDGRPASDTQGRVKRWRIDDARAAALVARFEARATPVPVDYEHQMLHAPENGQPAPASGFIKRLEWRPGVGLFGEVDWTARAKAMIAGGEYRYFSPVFSWNPNTGEVVDLLQGALTNDPALDGMQAITARAAARFQSTHTETSTMNPLLAAVLAALALPATSTEEQAIVALKSLKDRPDPLDAVRSALGLDTNVDASAVTTAVSALKSKADKAADPDPTRYVPIAAFEEVKAQVVALTTKHREDEVAALVEEGLADGRLLTAQKEWAESLGKSDIAALKTYLQKTPAIAALRSSQTRGAPPEAANEHNLNDAELAVCRTLAIEPAEFAKQRTPADQAKRA